MAVKKKMEQFQVNVQEQLQVIKAVVDRMNGFNTCRNTNNNN